MANEQDHQDRDQPPVGRLRQIYILALMTMVYFFYLVDRNALITTQELIKDEFHLTDTQIGMVTGILYGAAYGLAGLPLGWLSQRVHRVRLLSLLIAIWSGLTALCGLAGQFWHLAAARILVGAAESGGAPISLSILHPLFRKERRATVSSIFYAGAGIGSIVSFFAGGYLASAYGWRAVFLICGAPGIALAILILFVVPEPHRPVEALPLQQKRSGLLKDLAELLRNRDLRPIYIGSALFSMCNGGFAVWTISYLVRSHGFSLGTAGTIAALAIGGFGTLGSLVIAVLADRFEQSRPGRMLLFLSLAALVNGLGGVLAVMAGDPTIAIIGFCIWGATSLCYMGPSNTAISHLVPPRLMGLAFAFYSVVANLIGAGFGPLIVGALSDWFHPTFGASSIRPALVIICSVQLGAAFAFFRARSRWLAAKRRWADEGQGRAVAV